MQPAAHSFTFRSRDILQIKSTNFRFASSAVLRIVVEINQRIRAVYDSVHNPSHDKGGSHIKQRMLFDKDGRHNNRNAKNQRTDSNHFMVS